MERVLTKCSGCGKLTLTRKLLWVTTYNHDGTKRSGLYCSRCDFSDATSPDGSIEDLGTLRRVFEDMSRPNWKESN